MMLMAQHRVDEEVDDELASRWKMSCSRIDLVLPPALLNIFLQILHIAFPFDTHSKCDQTGDFLSAIVANALPTNSIFNRLTVRAPAMIMISFNRPIHIMYTLICRCNAA